jgi:hypothetical protein
MHKTKELQPLLLPRMGGVAAQNAERRDWRGMDRQDAHPTLAEAGAGLSRVTGRPRGLGAYPWMPRCVAFCRLLPLPGSERATWNPSLRRRSSAATEFTNVACRGGISRREPGSYRFVPPGTGWDRLGPDIFFSPQGILGKGFTAKTPSRQGGEANFTEGKSFRTGKREGGNFTEGNEGPSGQAPAGRGRVGGSPTPTGGSQALPEDRAARSGVHALPSNVRGLISRGLERKGKNMHNVLVINDLRIITQVVDSSTVTAKKGVFRHVSHP